MSTQNKQLKPKNKAAINPILKKGHAHKSVKDYDRKKAKQETKKILDEAEKS